MNPISFRLNGCSTTLHADSDTPLVYALRNDLGLKGTRLGCGVGQCGSCTVLLNGRPVTSCTTAIQFVADADVETIESLVSTGGSHPLLISFISEQAGQCGYCLSGILMRAKALLDDNPRPSRSDITDALDAHICRCGAHVRIMRAIERAASLVARESK